MCNIRCFCSEATGFSTFTFVFIDLLSATYWQEMILASSKYATTKVSLTFDIYYIAICYNVNLEVHVESYFMVDVAVLFFVRSCI